MGMGMDEVDIQPRPPQPPQQQPHHHHQSQPQAAPPQQQGRNPNPHPHPHPIQRRDAAAGGGGAGPGGHPSNNHGLSLSLPLHLAAGGSSSGRAAAAPAQAPGNGGGAAATGSAGDRHGHGHGHGRDDCWSEGATNTLIEAWGDRYLELNRGNLKQKHWKDVADAVSHRGGGDCSKPPKTDVQCKNRLDTLKKKYKLEKGKIFSGGAASKWPFFHKLDELIGPSRKHQTANGGVHQHLPGATKALPAAAAAPPGPKSAKEIRPPDDAHAHAHLRAVNQNNNNNNNNMTMNSGSSKSDETPDTTDSCPNGLDVTVNGKAFKKRKMPAEDGSGGGPLRELTRAILKFGEVYERVERSKQQQLMDLEKQRMEFIKEMELQRMQLFMQTQLELAKLKHAKHGNTEHYL